MHKPDISADLNVILLTDALRDVPLTGIGRYVLELAQGLHAHQDVAGLRCFAGRSWVHQPWQDILQKASGSGGQVSLPCITSLRRRLPCRGLQDRLSFALKKQVFSIKSRALTGHVLHAPNYLLLPFDGPSLVTIHDLSFMHYPDCHPRERIALLERELPKTLSQASMILTDTEFVRHEIIKILGVPQNLVAVTPMGVDPRFQPGTREQTAKRLEGLGLKHGQYLLSVSTLEPRKNLVRLVRAYARLPDALTASFPLVLAGSSGWLTQPLETLIHPLERAGKIHRLGYVHESCLPRLFAGAAGLALPSLYEGFGLPVLEAMSCAVPVLTSDCSSLPEVAGEAALLVNPLDEDAIFHGLQRLLTDDVFREHAKHQGPLQAKRFTWENCVSLTIAAYRKTLQMMSV